MHPDSKFKKILIYSLFIYSLFNYGVSYAQDSCVYDSNTCAQFQTDIDNQEAPDPRALVCILARVVNLFVLSAGLVLLYMILWGAIKLAMSWGDPKGYLGAQNTFLYAFIGFFVVVGCIAFYVIIASLLGLPQPSLSAVTEGIMVGLVGILNMAGVICN